MPIGAIELNDNSQLRYENVHVNDLGLKRYFVGVNVELKKCS